MRFRIVPANREFFDDFSLAAKNLAESVDRLGEVLSDTANAEQRHQAVKDVERAGDELTDQILTRLASA